MKRFAIIIGLIGLMGVAKGQTMAKLEADTIALGDQTVLTVSNAEQYPSTDMLSVGGIVALGQQFDTVGRVQRTLITCFEPGEHWVHYNVDDSLLLYVNDVAIDTASMEPRDIAPLERVPYTFWELFRWVLLVWAVAAVVIVVWWLIDRKKRHGSIIVHHEPVDTRTPEQRALDALESLRRQQMWQAGKTKKYHTELTDIVRRFIEEATGIRATEMTSEETLEAVGVRSSEFGVRNSDGDTPAVHEVRTSEFGELRDIFVTADLVKFAKSEPLPHEHERSMDAAVQFVKTFWQAVKPAEKGEEAADE